MRIWVRTLLLVSVLAQLQPLACPEKSLLAISDVTFSPSPLQANQRVVVKVKGANGANNSVYVTNARLVIFASDPAYTIITDFNAATFSLPNTEEFNLKAAFMPEYTPGKATYTLQLFQGLNPVGCYTDTLQDSAALLLSVALLAYLA